MEEFVFLDAETNYQRAIALLEVLRKSLPSKVDPATKPFMQKVVFKYAVYREALLWRTVDLAEGACSEAREKRAVGCVILTRSVLENTAALYFVRKTVLDAIKRQNTDNLDARAMRLLMGSRQENWRHQSINVLTFLDTMDKELPGIRKYYDGLSEFVHPNWMGTHKPFARFDHSNIATHFGKEHNETQDILGYSLNAIVLSLDVFGHFYNELSDMMKKFNELVASTAN